MKNLKENVNKLIRLWKTSVIRKIQKIKSKSNAKLKITIVILSENNKNEYQHCISSTSNTNFMSIPRYQGPRFKKSPEGKI